MLRTSSPTWQVKAASILEYIAAFESHATIISASDIEAGLDDVFQQASSGGMWHFHLSAYGNFN